MHLDLTDLRIFRAVAETGSFSRAAALLYLAQPTVSHRMASLEQEVGTQLFTRTGRGVQLTPAGNLFLGYAERGLDNIDEGARAIIQYLLGRSGSIALGCASSTASYILPQILRGYVVSHPDVDVRVRTGHSREVLDLLGARQVDVALVRLEVRQPEFVAQMVLREPIHLVALPEHRIASDPDRILEPTDLRGVPLIVYYRYGDFWEHVYAALEQAGGKVHRAMELDSLEAVRAMALAGLGLAFLPASTVHRDVQAGRLTRLQLGGISLPDRVTSLARRSDTPFIGPVAEIWDELFRGFAASEFS